MLFISIALAAKNLRANLEPRSWGREGLGGLIHAGLCYLQQGATSTHHPLLMVEQCPAPPQALGNNGLFTAGESF